VNAASNSKAVMGDKDEVERVRRQGRMKSVLESKEWDAVAVLQAIKELVDEEMSEQKAVPIPKGTGHANAKRVKKLQRVLSLRFLRMLSDEKIKALDVICSTDRCSFDDLVYLVHAFYWEHGCLPSPNPSRKRDEEYQRLSEFLSDQRRLYGDGRLSEGRIGAMKGIPGFRWGHQRTFEDSVRLVLAFHAKHGELPKRGGEREDGDEDRLANFLTRQRGYYHDGQLDGDRIKAMENIPDFKWTKRRRAISVTE
jgi:hypothetical protein